MQPGMLTSQLLPDVSRARALRQGERPLVGPYDVFEYREEKKLNMDHLLNPEPRTQNPEPRTQIPLNRLQIKTVWPEQIHSSFKFLT